MSDWRTLPAGPELDAIVGRTVIGCKVESTKNLTTGAWRHECRCEYGEHEAPGSLGALMRFSTTWDGMGLVVERMRELGWHWSGVNRLSENEWSGAAAFLFGNGPYPIENPAQAEAPTVPLATCRAALAALEAK